MVHAHVRGGKSGEIRLKNPENIPKELRQCIKSITQHETQHAKYLKLELHSKVAALGMLAKYHNLFKRIVASQGPRVSSGASEIKQHIFRAMDE